MYSSSTPSVYGSPLPNLWSSTLAAGASTRPVIEEGRSCFTGVTASASISTFHAGSRSPLTTHVAAGRTSRNASPCARATSGQCSGAVTYIRRPHDVLEARPGTLERLADEREAQRSLLVGALRRR